MRNHDESNQPKAKQVVVNEVSADHDIHKLVKEQSQQIAAQQKQIESLLAALHTNKAPRVGGPRKCWSCDSPDHLKRNCPKNTDTKTTQDNLNKRGPPQ